MFKRKIIERLKEWKNKRQGRTALLVEGQRRVGKSTVVEAFARKAYKSYVLIDFSACEPEVLELFDHVTDLDYFFLRLQLVTGVDLVPRKSVIIFDEVQLFPKARQAIKRLVADHRYDYIETGSLISIRKNVKDILIPSEEEHIAMHPMDFEEFLWAIGDTVTFKLLQKLFETKQAAGDAAHRKLMRLFRLYMLVGGMPQAVAEYLKTNNLESVDAVTRDILRLYADDFRKIDGSGKLSLLFEAIPAQLNKNTGRYAVSSVLPTKRPNTALGLIAELIDSRTVSAAYHTSQPSAAMASYKDLGRFKLFLSDTGLFTTLMFRNKAFTENDLYRKLLSDKTTENLGYLYENIVVQMLTARGYELFYHTFNYQDSKKKYEIDFLIEKKGKICPIEVKSGVNLRHASLDGFGVKYSAQVAEKWVLCTKDYKKERDVQYLPVYMASLL